MGFLGNIFGKNDASITQDDVKGLVKAEPKAMLIDVRTYAEYRTDHINPCQNISLQEGGFEDKVKYLDKDNFYVLYCRSETRSKKARKKMMKLGFSNVYTLKGGIQRWVGAKKVK